MKYLILMGLLFSVWGIVPAQSLADCEKEVTITESIGTGGKDYRQASSIIRASHNIGSGAVATYSAGRNVKLLPGFHARRGASLHIGTEECSSSPDAGQANTRTGHADIPEGGADQLPVLYPNPASQTLFVRLGSGDAYTFDIYSRIGRKLSSGKLTGRIGTIDVSNLKAGTYFISIVNYQTGETARKRFAIAR